MKCQIGCFFLLESFIFKITINYISWFLLRLKKVFITNKIMNQNCQNQTHLPLSSSKQISNVQPFKQLDSTFRFCRKYTKKREPRIKTLCQHFNDAAFVQGIKAKLHSKSKIDMETKNIFQKQKRKSSNFQILKRKISYLQHEDILGNKEKKNTPRRNQSGEDFDYLISGQFFSNKKISFIQKYRHNIKNKDQNRKLSHTRPLQKYEGTSIVNFQPMLIKEKQHLQNMSAQSLPKQIYLQNKSFLLNRQQLASQCAKRYFRQQSQHGHIRSTSKFEDSLADIKGIKIHECSKRYNKSTINFL